MRPLQKDPLLFASNGIKTECLFHKMPGKTIFTGPEVSTISISSIQSADSGNYTCIVDNDFGSDQHTASLTVDCEFTLSNCVTFDYKML